MLILLIPLACGLVFPLLAWWLKRAMIAARDTWGTLWCANTALVAVFAPPFLLQGDYSLSADEPLWQPLLCGLFFLVGQVAAYRSFEKGDLSVAVPVQGTKVLMVAGAAVLFFGHEAGPRIWVAAALTPVALLFMRGHAPGKSETLRHRSTLWLATAAAAGFAGLDVGIEAWANDWGVWRFGFWTFGAQALLSQAFLFFPGKRFHFARGARRLAWSQLLAGAMGLAIVTLGLTWVIAVSGQAAWTNILFNSRLLFSIVFVALGARWLAKSREERREASGWRGGLLRKRLLGAALMMATIVLAVL